MKKFTEYSILDNNDNQQYYKFDEGIASEQLVNKEVFIIPKCVYDTFCNMGGSLSEIRDYSKLKELLTSSDISYMFAYNYFVVQLLSDIDMNLSDNWYSHTLDAFFDNVSEKDKAEYSNSTMAAISIKLNSMRLENEEILNQIDPSIANDFSSYVFHNTNRSGYYVIVADKSFTMCLKVRDFQKKFVSDCLRTNVLNENSNVSRSIFIKYLSLLQKSQRKSI